MDRTELNQKLQRETKHYLGIPYFSNYITNPRQKYDSQVGKGDWRQIQKYTQTIAAREKVDLTQLNPQQLYNFQKKHHIGIDCSGLTYHLSDFLYRLVNNTSIRPHLIGTGDKTNPRRLSAHLLTSPPNAIPITNWTDIQIGDLIRTNNGKHIMFIYKKTKNSLSYIHSRRQNRLVKTGTLTTSDSLSIHRLKCLTSLQTILRT